jgi:putative ABC transport system ATP-binding protein
MDHARGLPVIEITGLDYAWPGQPRLFSIESLRAGPGETVLLQGPSGSGKTTLLGLVTGVLLAPAGTVRVLGKDLALLSAFERDGLRGASMGVIFQLFNLLPFLSVLDNVLLPLRLFPDRAGSLNHPETMRVEAIRLLNALGLGKEKHLDQPVHQLSVGQQQRVAAARALIGQPALIVADEPTSALDESVAKDFLSLLIDQVKQTQTTLLMASHDTRLVPLFNKVIQL